MTHEKGFQGFWWNESLNMSLRLKNRNETVKEIIKMVKHNGYKLMMTVELKNKTIIEFNY
jgi:acetolactate synthase regulatory subunit